MVCMPSSTGRRTAATGFSSAMSTPRGRPMIRAMRTAVMMTDRLSIAIAQRPNMPMTKGSDARTTDAMSFFEEYQLSRNTTAM